MGNEEIRYVSSNCGEETCAHCTSHNLGYRQDIYVGNETWSPIDCDTCKERTYEIWRGFNLVRIVRVIVGGRKSRPKKSLTWDMEYEEEPDEDVEGR